MSFTQENTMKLARQIFLKGVSAVIPSNLIRNQVNLNESILKIQQHTIDLNKYTRSFIIGFGKAVLPMAEEMLSIMENKVDKCLLSVPEGTREQINPKIEMYRGAKNNIPDLAAFQSAVKIVDIVKSCTENDLLIVLISGGGSALLPYPKPPITLDEKINFIKKLSSSGASINELNTIRKKISIVKGGGLIHLCPAKHIISLILSDVLQDPLDIIASGPTFVSNHTDNNNKCLSITQKYLKQCEIPSTIMNVLLQEEESSIPQNDTNDDFLKIIDNIIIGNNKIALNSAADEALKEGLIPNLITCSLEGEARNIGEKITILSHFISRMINNYDYNEGEKNILTTLEYLHCNNISSSSNELLKNVKIAKEKNQGICLLFGGETTVTVHGNGIGGRNQELVLSAAITLNSLVTCSENITILSGGTDGIDGPCSAAGGIVNTSTCINALKQNFKPQIFLDNNDSYNFFHQVSNGYYHIVTGHTGTNVMDIIVVIIYPKLQSQ